jgi:hypothetical protein
MRLCIDALIYLINSNEGGSRVLYKFVLLSLPPDVLLL